MTKAERDDRLRRTVAGLEALRGDLAFPVEAHLPITHAVLARLDEACAGIKGVLGDDTDDAEAPDEASIGSTQVPTVPPGSAGGAAAHPETGRTTNVPFSEPLSEGDTASIPGTVDFDPSAQAEVERDAASRQQGVSRGDTLELREPAVPGATADPEAVELREPSDPLAFLKPEQRAALAAAGYGTPEAIRAEADDRKLDDVPGIGPETVKRLREATKA
jgi:hypothetical protein